MSSTNILDLNNRIDELRHADNIMMSDGVTSVEDAVDGLTGNMIKTPVSITSYTSASHPYIAPSDGYARFAGNTTIGLRTGDSSHNALLVTLTDNSNSIFIKKGQKIYFTATPSEGLFFPLGK